MDRQGKVTRDIDMKKTEKKPVCVLGRRAEVKLFWTHLCMRMSKYIYEPVCELYFEISQGVGHTWGAQPKYTMPYPNKEQKWQQKSWCKQKYLFKQHLYNSKNLSHIFYLKILFHLQNFLLFFYSSFLTEITNFFLLLFALFGKLLGIFWTVFLTIKISFFMYVFLYMRRGIKKHALGQFTFYCFLGSSYRKLLNAISNEPNFRP